MKISLCLLHYSKAPSTIISQTLRALWWAFVVLQLKILFRRKLPRFIVSQKLILRPRHERDCATHPSAPPFLLVVVIVLEQERTSKLPTSKSRLWLSYLRWSLLFPQPFSRSIILFFWVISRRWFQAHSVVFIIQATEGVIHHQCGNNRKKKSGSHMWLTAEANGISDVNKTLF